MFIIISIIIFSLVWFQIFIYRYWQKKLFKYKYFSLLKYTYLCFVLFFHLFIWLQLITRKTSFKINFSDDLFYFYTFALMWHHVLLITLLFGGIIFLTVFFYNSIYNFYTKFLKKEEVHVNSKGISRQDFLLNNSKLIVSSLPFIAFPFGIAGIFTGSRELSIDKISIRIDNIHPDLYGFKIAQISDIHIGSLINDTYLKVVYDLLLQTKADMLVVTGDIIDNDSYYAPYAAKFFRSLERHFKYGCYGIMGNHDYFNNGKYTAKTLNQSGLNMLMNKMLPIQRGRGKFQLIGLDYPYPLFKQEKERTKSYFNNIYKNINHLYPTVLLNHNPRDFEYFKQYPISLVLSGHTHGGQIRFVEHDYNHEVFAPIDLFMKYTIGLYQEQKSQLYINRGTGHSIPLRMNCPPEITVIELI